MKAKRLELPTGHSGSAIDKLQFFQDIIEAFPHPFLLIDAKDYTVKYFNSAVSNYPASEKLICYTMMHNRSAPCDGEGLLCPLEKIRKTKKPVKMEHLHRDKNNDIINVEVNAYPIFDDKGKVVQIVETWSDITEYKIKERLLEKSESELNTVIKTVGEGIVVIEESSTIRMVSKELCRIFGYSENELVGKKLQLLMPEKYRSHHETRMMEHVKGAPPRILGKRVELEGLRRDGTVFPIELRIEETKEEGNRFFTGAIRDISERKQMEEGLINSEETFRTLVQSINGYLYSIRYDDRGSIALTYHSPQCEAITGYSPEDYLNDRNLWVKMIYEDDMELVINFFNDLKTHGNSNRIEHRIVKKNGDIIWVLNQCTIRNNGDGMTRRTDGLILDITEHRKAEQALKESERNFRTIFESAVDGILITDRETKKIFLANEMICRMLGYSQEEMIEMSIMNIHPEEALPHIMQKFERQSRGEIHIAEDLPVKRKDTTVFYADVNSSFYVLGGQTYVLSIFRDVTERKLAEEAIRSSEEKFRSVTQSVSDAIISTDVDGNILSWNGGAKKIFGYEVEEVLGKPYTTLIPERLRDQCIETIKQGMSRLEKTSTISSQEMHGLRNDGSELPIEMSLSIWEMNGSIFYTAIIRDITDRKKNEAGLIKAKEEAEKATELKDKFISLVSHDLKAPITTILGYLQIMRGDSYDRETISSFIDEAVASCEDMTTLITEVLDMSRIRSGAIEPRFSFVDAHHIAKYALERYQLMARNKGVELKNNIPENTRIYADEKLYYEAFRNLLSNAIKFCSRGDSVSFYVTEEEPFSIAISDTGLGIEADRLKDLFAYEKKTSTRGTEGESGTGLGLPLTRDIIEAQGGKVIVKSAPGKGSTFYLCLPYVRPKILVIDDEPHIVDLIKQFSGDLNVDIFESLDGKTGISIIENDKPHLIILDMLLPDMNGLEILKKIKNTHATKRIPVIVITGQSERDVAGSIFQLGADDFVAKPFYMEDLLPRIRRFII